MWGRKPLISLQWSERHDVSTHSCSGVCGWAQQVRLRHFFDSSGDLVSKKCNKQQERFTAYSLALWSLCWDGKGLLLSVLTNHLNTVMEVWQSGREEVGILGAGHRHFALPGGKLCPLHWSSSWARSTECALPCYCVGMHQSQSRHFGAKERHSLCSPVLVVALLPAVGRTRWPWEVPSHQHFCDPVSVLFC